MLQWLLVLTLATVPFFVCNGFGDGIRLPKEILSVFLLSGIVGFGICNYGLKPLKNKPLVFFWLWCIFSILFTSSQIPIFFSKGVIEISSMIFVWKEIFYITLALLIIHVLSSYETSNPLIVKVGKFEWIEDKKINFHFVANVVNIIILINCLFCIVQAIGFDQIFRVADPNTGWVGKSIYENIVNSGAFCRRVVAFTGNPSILGIWLAMCLPFLLYIRKWFTFILSIIIIGISFSFTAYATALTSIFVYLFFLFKKHLKIVSIMKFLIFILIFITLFGSLFIYGVNNKNLKTKVLSFMNPVGRFEIWKETFFKYIVKKPLFGNSLGTYEYLVGGNPEIVKNNGNENWKEMHNEFGQIWFSLGLIGLILFLWLIIAGITGFFKNINSESILMFSCMMSFLVASVPYFTFRVAPLSTYGVIFAGLFYNSIKKEN